MATQTATLRAEFDDKASQGIGKLQAAMAVAAGSSLALGNGLKAAGASAKVLGFVMTTVGTGMIASLGGAANAAAQFRQELALAKTQVDDSRISLDFLAETAHDIGAEIPGEFERMPRLMFDLFSTLHPEIDKVEGATRAFMKAATAGYADIQDVSRTTMQVLNAFYSDFNKNTGTMGVQVEDINKVLDMQFRMVQRGTGSYDELTSAVNRVIPAAKGAGQEVETMMGSIAFLTRMGVPAQMAGTSVARAMEVIGRSSEDLEAMGITARTANGEFRQINEIIGDMASEWADLSKPEMFRALDEAFSGQGWRIQARRFFQLAIPNFEILNALINDVAMSSSDMQKAFETVSDQPALQMKLLQQQTKILVQEIGTEFLPHLKAVIETGQDVVQWLRDYNKESGTSIGRIIAMGGAFLTMAGILTTATGALMVFKGLAITTKISFIGLFGKVALFVGIIGAAIAAVVALSQKFEDVKEAGFNVMAGFEQAAFSGNRLHQAIMLLAVGSAPALIKNWRKVGPAISNSLQAARAPIRSLRAEIAGTKEAFRAGAAGFSEQEIRARSDAIRRSVMGEADAFAHSSRVKIQSFQKTAAASAKNATAIERHAATRAAAATKAAKADTVRARRVVAAADEEVGKHRAVRSEVNKRFNAARSAMDDAKASVRSHTATINQSTESISRDIKQRQVLWGRHGNVVKQANKEIAESTASTSRFAQRRVADAQERIRQSYATTSAEVDKLNSRIDTNRQNIETANRRLITSHNNLRDAATRSLTARREYAQASRGVAEAQRRVGAANQQANTHLNNAAERQRRLVTVNQASIAMHQRLAAATTASAGATRGFSAALAALSAVGRTAGRAAGFLLTGIKGLLNPTTVVIGAVIGLVAVLQHMGKQSREAAQQVDTLTNSLKQAEAQVDALSASGIRQSLDIDQGALNRLEAVGLSFGEIVNAAKEGGSAITDIQQQMNEFIENAPRAIEVDSDMVPKREIISDFREVINAVSQFESSTQTALENIAENVASDLGIKSVRHTDAYRQAVHSTASEQEAFTIAIRSALRQSENLDQALQGLDPETRKLAQGMAQGEHNVNQLAASATDARSRIDDLSESFGDAANDIIDASAAMESQFERTSAGADIASQGISDMIDTMNESRQKRQEVINEARKDVARASDELLVRDVETIDMPDLEIPDLSLGQLAQGIDATSDTYEGFFEDIQRVTSRGAGDVAKMLFDMGEDGIDIITKLADAGDEQFVSFVDSARRNMDAAAQPFEDFTDRAVFSIDRWIDKMEEQVQAAKDFENNIAKIMARTGGSKDILQLISESERPELVAAGLVDATDEQLNKLQGISDEQGKRSSSAFTNGFQRALEEFPNLTRLLTSGQIGDVVANADDLSFDTLETALKERINERAIAVELQLRGGDVSQPEPAVVEVKLRSAISTSEVERVERKLRDHTSHLGTEVGSTVAHNIGQGVIENISPALPNAMSAFDSRLNSEGNQMGVTADNVGRSVVERLAGGIDSGRDSVARSLAQLRAMTTAQLNSVLADINSARSRLAVQRAATEQPITGLAHGGPVRGPSGHDKVPAALTAGEWVINKGVSEKMGPAFMRALNEGRLTERNSGGRVGSPAPVGTTRGRDPLLTEVKGLRHDLKSQRVVSVAVHNPQPEPASTSVTRELRKRTGSR